jgi:succinoglycan biosynthesis transport protein ExoP
VSAAPKPVGWEEIAPIFGHVELLREKTGSAVIQVVASQPGEGASTIAWLIATFAASAESHKILCISSSPPRQHQDRISKPALSLVEAARQQRPLRDCVAESNLLPYLAVARFFDKGDSIRYDDREAVLKILAEARKFYQVIILDCPPLSGSPQSAYLSRSSDGVALVVEAERTRAPVVRHSVETILGMGGKVLGIVLNKRQFYVPQWIYARL